MNSMYIATIIMTILTIWILLVSYHYAYKRKWGNENASVDPLPEQTNDQQHSEGRITTPTEVDAHEDAESISRR